jgi:transcriptional regulator with XRE-family HTH domain
VTVDAANEIAEFLTTRRANVTPDQVGLPVHGRRRVPGLRREEVASLAGVSIDYYKRLERGHVSGVSDSVLEALAQALQLNDAERAHLYDLARAANPVMPRRPRRVHQGVRPAVQRILDSLDTPALARNARLDHIAANQLGRALYAPMWESSEQPPNSARWCFLDPTAVDFYPDWERVAKDLVAHLRSHAGSNPHDRGLSDLVGELSTRSQAAGRRRHWTSSAAGPRHPSPEPHHLMNLNNGIPMPEIALGVFQTPPDETRDAVRAALDTGRRGGPEPEAITLESFGRAIPEA